MTRAAFPLCSDLGLPGFVPTSLGEMRLQNQTSPVAIVCLMVVVACLAATAYLASVGPQSATAPPVSDLPHAFPNG